MYKDCLHEDGLGSLVQPVQSRFRPVIVQAVSRDLGHEDGGGVGGEVQQVDVSLPSVEDPHLPPVHPAGVPVVRVLPVV